MPNVAFESFHGNEKNFSLEHFSFNFLLDASNRKNHKMIFLHFKEIISLIFHCHWILAATFFSELIFTFFHSSSKWHSRIENGEREKEEESWRKGSGCHELKLKTFIHLLNDISNRKDHFQVDLLLFPFHFQNFFLNCSEIFLQHFEIVFHRINYGNWICIARKQQEKIKSWEFN